MIELCPLEAAWGNFADWAAVVVGVGAAVATTFVAVLAHRTSKRAAEIAEEATKIAAQQHHELIKTREANGKIVGRVLVHEVSQLPVELFALRASCERVLARGLPTTEDEVEFLEKTLRRAAKSLLRGTEQSEDRLHTLPDMIGNELAVLIGYSRSLNELSAELLSFITTKTYANRAPSEVKVFGGTLKHIEYLKNYLEMFSTYCLDVVNELRVYVGAERADLSKFVVDKPAS
ncbi:hypothetical protein LN461_19140 [Xanthomonas arboricola]|uniref:hypothetical protein n=1 Tax=Xanthomonas arboricola TaxID=56448 RepID=UPI001E55B2CB|nr:hypothetical protein [Xanthomonas arboricola]MCC8671452.1 hypothetical protein [Xanthomonas arboricola]